MNDYMFAVLNKNFDEDGFIASSGPPVNKEIEEFLKNNFKLPPPKSLDRRAF